MEGLSNNIDPVYDSVYDCYHEIITQYLRRTSDGDKGIFAPCLEFEISQFYCFFLDLFFILNQCSTFPSHPSLKIYRDVHCTRVSLSIW